MTPRRSFAAWFEPTHHSVEPTADFFVRRFADMDWRILTPDVSAIFENGQLTFQEGHKKPDLPDDAGEQLWVTYFRNIFNPARLKVKAMQSEMPRKYWKNLPEAASIPDLIAQGARAGARDGRGGTVTAARAYGAGSGRIGRMAVCMGWLWRCLARRDCRLHPLPAAPECDSGGSWRRAG